MRIIDLTHSFQTPMPVYPGDTPPMLEQTAYVEKGGVADHVLHSGMHVGTHIDAPFHMKLGGLKISELPIERFVGPGVIIDARGHTEIPASVLDGKNIPEQSIVLLYTDHSKKFREPDFYTSHALLSLELAEALKERKISMVGMDMPSPDSSPFPVHKSLFENDILIIESLTNLEQLLTVESFTIVALPLNIAANASPSRVIALYE